MVGVGDRNGQRVGRIGAAELHAGQQPRDHRLHLLLLRAAGADDGFLDDAGMIFADHQFGLRHGEQSDPARLTEFQSRLRVGIAEHLLDRRALRLIGFHDLHDRTVEQGQPARQGHRRIGADLAVGDMRQAIAVGTDDAPAGGAEARIDAEDQHRRKGDAGRLSPVSPSRRRARHNCPRRSGRRHRPPARRSASSACQRPLRPR
jgi:hypothetical protein